MKTRRFLPVWFTTLLVASLTDAGTAQPCLDSLYGLHKSAPNWKVGNYAASDLSVLWVRDAPVYDSHYLTELAVSEGYLYGLHKSDADWKFGKYDVSGFSVVWIKDVPIYDSHYITEFDVSDGYLYGLHESSPDWKVGKYNIQISPRFG